MESSGKVLEICVMRNDEALRFSVEMFEEKDGKVVPRSVLGVAPKDISYENVGVVGSISAALVNTYDVAAGNISAIFKIVTGSMSAKSIGGIISIFKVSADSAAAGLVSFIFMIAMISTTLGAINLLPVPVLDGGAVVIAMVEQIIGQPLNKKFVDAIFSVGLVAVVGLMVVGMWNDLVGCKILDSLKSYFNFR
jgi:regulator of sigma E protease